MPKVTLKKIDVTAIKRRIWFGETRGQISKDFKVHIGHVCKIGSGYKHPMVPWPDHSIGGLPKERADKIKKARRIALQNLRFEVRKVLRSLD